MNIIRCSDQAFEALEDSYRRLGNKQPNWKHWPDVATRMINLLARLRATPDERVVYGLTSHDHLCLLAADDYRSPWYVIIQAYGSREEYEIQFLLPPERAPWPRAYVNGPAFTIEEALSMTLLAMDESGGWRPS